MADTPSPPSPEILEKLRQLREELAQKAAQQAPKDANTLAWQQSNAFKRVYPRANGGEVRRFDVGGSNSISIDELNEALRERAPTIPEQFNRYIAPHIQRGLDAMLPFRQLAQKTFERNVYNPLSESVINNIGAAIKTSGTNASDVEDAKTHMANAARRAAGMAPQPIPFDPKKQLGDINAGEFDRQYVDMDIRHAKRLEEFKRQQAMGRASGGVIDMDRMRLELMNKDKPKRIRMAEGGSEDDYRGEHTAPGPHYGAPMHDVSSGGMYPADFYGNNGRRYYANEGWDFDDDAYSKVTRVKNKPNEMVSIYRAVPTSVYKEALKKEMPLKHMIRKGDWVAINKEYAKAHGESVLNNNYKIAAMRVPAKHVWTNADSIHEWGYHPEEEKKAKGGPVMGVNVASDRKHNLNYADLIVDGHKTIESRNSDTLRPYVGKRVAIVRTGAGKAKAIGEVTIGEPIVANKKQFRNMESHHLVPEGSTFDIKTPTKHMYPLSEPVRYDEERDVGHGILSRKVIHEAKGGSVKEPKNTVKAYKLFRVHPKHPGKLFPLFVNANEPVEMNKWVDAKEGEMAGDKVKSKIGPLAYRPGWHAGDLPVATHIGEKSDPNLTAPDVRPANHVWAEVEMPHDVDWQSVANERGMNPKGKLIARNAHITDQIPKGGHYRYKTNSNMTGNWLIGGSMKVNRVLHDKEVKAINKAAGAADLPRTRPFKAKDYGFASGGVVAPDEWKAEEHVNYMAKGGSRIASIKEIEDYIRQKRGEHSAKRVQRAADEIPGLENMYTPEALQHTFERHNSGLMSMDPADFEKFAERMRADITRRDSDRRTRTDEVLPFNAYLNHLAQLKGGFDEVPFLELGHRDPEYLPSIEGHEGRHRSRALAGKGVKKSLVQLMPAARMSLTMPKRNSEKLVQKLNQTLGKDRFVSPEGGGLLPSDQTAGMYNWMREKKLLEANRPQLPEVYKSGGATHAHHLDIEERPL